jgi:hypothetical protein
MSTVNKFKVLEYVKKKNPSSGFKNTKVKNNTSKFPNLINNKQKICKRINDRSKFLYKSKSSSEFPKLTKSLRIFNGGRRRKTIKKH